VPQATGESIDVDDRGLGKFGLTGTGTDVEVDDD
jgi:hypothetical protein